MKIIRNPLGLLFPNIRNFLVVLDHDLCQLKAVRWLCGGVWFKSYGSWKQCDRIMCLEDGTFVLKYKDISFHETHASVQALEIHE